MKKKFLILCTVVVFAVIAVFAYFEMRFPHFEFEQTVVSEAFVLKAQPDAVFTDADKKLLHAVLALPEVQEALGTEYSLEFSKEICDGLKKYLPSGATACRVYYVGSLVKSVNVVCEFGEEKTIQYLVDGDLGHFEKAVAIYRVDARGDTELKEMYSNLNGEYTKYTQKRQWFAWLRETA